MKREKRQALLREFYERDFGLDEILNILNAVDLYCSYRKHWLEMPREYEKAKISARVDLEKTLASYGLDYSVSDFIEND